ncbi:hypothetical protein [Streptomyces hygroscopicus]|uniref:hypothetical protein n=1 Tax=Streptomyces hygroscopicus TaxID=1912 RepID=UPI002AD53E52|nr:hypothetical protein [Streptomyces hygroscopicus]
MLANGTQAPDTAVPDEAITPLMRGLTVLRRLTEADSSRATARRALITLEHLGCVTEHDRVFRLAPRFLSLSCPPLSRSTLREIATPHPSTLSQLPHASTSLAVLTGDDTQHTARVAANRLMSVNITVGTRLPRTQPRWAG